MADVPHLSSGIDSARLVTLPKDSRNLTLGVPVVDMCKMCMIPSEQRPEGNLVEICVICSVVRASRGRSLKNVSLYPCAPGYIYICWTDPFSSTRRLKEEKNYEVPVACRVTHPP